AQMAQLAVVREHLHQHRQLRYEAHRLEREPLRRNLTARVALSALAPLLLRLSLTGVHHSGHRLFPAAFVAAAALVQPPRVLQNATRRGLAAAEPERDAGLDLRLATGSGHEVRAEHLEHARRIGRDGELGEVGVDREAASELATRRLPVNGRDVAA